MKNFFNLFMIFTFAVLMTLTVSCGNKTVNEEMNDSIIEDTTTVVEDENTSDSLIVDTIKCDEAE